MFPKSIVEKRGVPRMASGDMSLAVLAINEKQKTAGKSAGKIADKTADQTAGKAACKTESGCPLRTGNGKPG